MKKLGNTLMVVFAVGTVFFALVAIFMVTNPKTSEPEQTVFLYQGVNLTLVSEGEIRISGVSVESDGLYVALNNGDSFQFSPTKVSKWPRPGGSISCTSLPDLRVAFPTMDCVGQGYTFTLTWLVVPIHTPAP